MEKRRRSLEGSMGKWADLSIDLLMLIAERVKHIEDFLSFGLVCTSWRQAAQSIRNSHIQNLDFGKKVFCIRAPAFAGHRKPDTFWYEFSISTRKNPHEVDPTLNLKLIKITKRIQWDKCLVVGLGSKIYSIKSFGYCRDVRVMDLLVRKKAWRRGPSMLNRRTRDARAVVCNGKVFVFGGCEPNSEPWAEILDPVENEWKPLNNAPAYVPEVDFFPIPFDDNCTDKKIVYGLGNDSHFHAYDIARNSWERIPIIQSIPSTATPFVIVCNTVYFMTSDQILAYDLHQQNQILSAFVPPLPDGRYTVCFHLTEDVFGVMWIENEPPRICCRKFKVSRLPNSLEVTSLDTQTYSVDQQLSGSFDGILLEKVAYNQLRFGQNARRKRKFSSLGKAAI